MEKYSPDELSRLVGAGDDAPLAAIPGHLTHAERVALRRARIDAIDKEQRRLESASERPPEAVTRGYARRAPVVALRPHQAPDDHEKASQAWLRSHLSGLYRIGAVWTVSEARLGYERWVWRAAVAGVLTHRRADIRSPEWAIARVARAIASGEIGDARDEAGYRPAEDWPKPLYVFARVKLPRKYEANIDA